MLIFRLALLVAVTFLGACGQNGEPTQWSGLYTWGHEVRSFCPCNQGACYWVQASPEINARLRDAVQNAARKPYTPVYVELTGYLAAGSSGELAADYDGILRVSQLERLDPEITCPLQRD